MIADFLVTSDLLCFYLCDRRDDLYTLIIIFLWWQGNLFLGKCFYHDSTTQEIVSVKLRILVSEI